MCLSTANFSALNSSKDFMEKTFSGQMNKRIDNSSACTTFSVKFILANRIENKHFQKSC